MPRGSDPGTIDLATSYAPPTSAVGQGGALQAADQQEVVVESAIPALQANELANTG